MIDRPSRQAGMTIEERERLVKVETIVNHIVEQVEEVLSEVKSLTNMANQGRGGLKVLLLVAGGTGGILGTLVGVVSEWWMRKP